MAYVPLINIEGSRLLKDLPVKIEEAKPFLNQPILKNDEIKAKRALATLNVLASNLNQLRNSIVTLTAKQKEEMTITLEDIVNTSLDAQEIICELDIQIQEMEREKPDPVQNTERIITTSTTSAKLPKLEIEKFDGKDITKFPEFWETFESAVDKTSLPQVQKFNYLRGLLTFDALKPLKGIKVQGENYEMAKQKILKRFGDEQVIVNTHYNELRSMPRANKDTKALRNALDAVEAHLCSLEVLGEDINHNSLLSILYDKFPREILMRIEETNNRVDMSTLRTSLDSIISSRERVENLNGGGSNFQTQNRHFSKTSNATPPTTNTPYEYETKTMSAICKFCGKDHYSDLCSEFKTLEQRKEKTKNLCSICLREGHNAKECNNTRACYYCKKRKSHHQSLCPNKFGVATSPTSATPTTSQNVRNDRETKKKEPLPKATATTTLLTEQKKTSTLSYADTTLIGTGKECSTLAVFDMGSEKTYITQELLKNLKLKPEYFENLNIGQFGGTSTEKTTAVVTLKLKLTDSTTLEIQANTIPKITGSCTNRLIPTDFCQTAPLNELKFADSGKFDSANLLIGNDYLFDILTLEKIEIKDHLYLIGSKLGWLLAGRTTNEQNTEQTTSLLAPLDDHIKKIWSLDTIGIKEKTDEIENENALNQFYEKVKYENNRYTVAWPWKTYPPELPTNYGLALGQLQGIVKRLDSSTLIEYNKIFEEQLSLNIIEEVNNYDKTNICHYLPHHAVFTPDKSTKMRLVFNGSAKTSLKNLSLNDCLMKGTILLEDLATLLIRFRQYQTAITADIEKAFLQVSLHKDDRDAVRFIWLKNIREILNIKECKKRLTSQDLNEIISKENLRIFRFTSVPFGVISSPFLLGITINFHLQKFPALKHLSDDFYVDNLITGTKDEKEAINLYDSLKNCFESASMNLRKWKSNSPTFNQALRNGDEEEQDTIPLLGLIWSTNNDVLTIKQPKKLEPDIKVTKRLALQQSSSIFDPLGFFAPVILPARIFIKNLWKNNYEWDQSVEEKLCLEWNEIAKNLYKISAIKIPRHIGNLIDENCQIHCFVDASKDAYAAVIYVRMKQNSDIRVKLIFAKARVSPVKEITIPRLELTAATIGARAIQFVQNALKQTTFEKSYLWTDSKCVLSWLKSIKILPIFVQRRVNEIKKLACSFRYVPSAENPADIASRGCSVVELQDSTWWSAPAWLRENENNWPNDMEISGNELDEKNDNVQTKVLLINENEIKPPFEIDITRFSTLNKLLHTTAYTSLAIKLFKKETVTKTIDLAEAEMQWIKYEQKRSYGNQHLPKITGLNVFRDDEGLLRCAGRIENAEIMTDAKYPILIPKCYFTELLIMKIHAENVGHGGTSHTLATLRSKYWVPQGRRVVYQTIKRKCFVCRRHDAKPFKPPQMAPLPKFRMDANSTPFTNVGIDVFGPILIQVNVDPKIPKEKRWIMIFTCLTVRAIHLEVLEKMTSGEILHAFRRFKARRTTPEIVISDNAPQFIVLENVIKELWKTITEDGEIQRYFTKEKIKWIRIPPSAPWMGGAYERLIQITKNAIKRTYNRITFSHRQLVTVAAEIEGIVNSRPLTYIGQEPDCVILTPNHFLQVKYPAFNIGDPENFGTPAQVKIIKLWKKSEEYLTQVWRYWNTHYLLSLRERNEKIKTNYRNTPRVPKIGEAVLIIDQSKNRGSWNIAIIEKLIPSNDGEIRSVQLRTNRNPTIRPITKIVPLELDQELDQEQWEITNEENQPQATLQDQSNEIVETELQQNGTATEGNDDFDEIAEIECLSLDGEEEL